MTKRFCVLLAAVLGLALVLALGSAALAAALKKGATYSGKTVRGVEPVSLKVSPSGKTVKASVSYPPMFCQGGGGGVKQITSPAKISASGSFTAKISYEFAPEHKIVAKLNVSGKFSGKKVKGTTRSEFLLAKQCNGTTTFSAAAG